MPRRRAAACRASLILVARWILTFENKIRKRLQDC
jgi:hypothetical protein